MNNEYNVLQMLTQPNGSYDLLRMREMLKLVEELRNSCNGWQKCIVSLMNGDVQEDKMRFLCLQTVEHYMKNSYAKASTSEQIALRQFLLRWIQTFCSKSEIPLANFVKNKVAQLFSLAFVHDYPERWPAFFDDLMNTLSLGPNAAENYLRVLKAVNSEIADRCLSCSILENARNREIKNGMRENNIQQIVSSLYDILKTYQVSHSELTSMCLETIAMYAHWIDVGLIVNPEFMSTLARLIPVPSLSESVIVCIEGVVRKKMEHFEKCKLVEFLMSMLRDVGVLSQLSAFDSKFTTKLARLMNSMGVTLLDSYGKLKREGNEVAQLHLFEVVIEDKIQILLQFFGNEENSVSKEVVEFAKSYIHFLKNRDSMSEQQTEMLQMLMVTTVHKMKYTKTYDYGSTGQDYEDFQEFRRGLKIILDGIICINKDLVFNYVLEMANQKMKEWSNSTFADIEVILTILLCIGESSLMHIGTKSDKRINLDLLINIVLESRVYSYPHATIQVLFFEVMVRFVNTLQSDSQKITSVISIFLDNFGLRHPDEKVRSRTASLFCKFIKASRSVLPNTAKQVLDLLREVLTAGRFPCYDVSSPWLCTQDQLYIFEAIGILVLTSSLTDSEKVGSLKDLMASNLLAFKHFYQELQKASNPTDCENLSDRLGHCVAVATRLSKGFTQKLTMDSIGCNCVFIECLDVFLEMFNIPEPSIYLRNSFRQFFKRMIASLNADIIPYVLKIIMHLIRRSDLQNLQDCLQYLVQITYKFRNESLPIFKDCIPQILSSVFGCLASPTDEKDSNEQNEREYLKKLFFQLISALVMSVPEAFYIQEFSVKKEILISVAQTTLQSHDPATQKECFLIFKNFIASLSERDASDPTAQFVYQTIIDVCFQALQKVKEPDSHHAILMVSQESALCLKGIHIKLGDEMTTYILNTYFSNASVPIQCKEQFARAINSDIKTLLIFLRGFYGINDSSS